MPLRTQRERLETLEQEERAEGIERRAEVAKDLDADLHSERHRAKRLTELEAMIAFGGFCEVGEAARLGPVEFACVNVSPAMNAMTAKITVPESMTTPPMVVPCPPIHFVAL